MGQIKNIKLHIVTDIKGIKNRQEGSAAWCSMRPTLVLRGPILEGLKSKAAKKVSRVLTGNSLDNLDKRFAQFQPKSAAGEAEADTGTLASLEGLKSSALSAGSQLLSAESRMSFGEKLEKRFTQKKAVMAADEAEYAHLKEDNLNRNLNDIDEEATKWRDRLKGENFATFDKDFGVDGAKWWKVKFVPLNSLRHLLPEELRHKKFNDPWVRLDAWRNNDGWRFAHSQLLKDLLQGPKYAVFLWLVYSFIEDDFFTAE